MSAQELKEDRATVEALDAAVARFKANLGSGDTDTLFSLATEVKYALMQCQFRAAAIRAQRRRADGH